MTYRYNYKESSSKVYGVATIAALTYQGINSCDESRIAHRNEKRLLKAFLKFRRFIYEKLSYISI